ncbi:MAG TPA: hypothetical protein VFZ18_08435 [Longimicrobiaceae bacterium]
MNESGSPRWTDPAALPPPSIYDPAEDAAPPFAGQVPAVVLLLVADADQRWAARTAIELSAAWAASGRRVMLADFHLEYPVLQDVLGGEGLEGVVDIFLYGASVARSSRPVEGRGFHFIPTGTYTADADALFRHPRWTKLVKGLRESAATLVIFAPVDAADLGALAAWVDQVILLGQPREPTQLIPLQIAGADIRGLIIPPRGESAAPPRPSAAARQAARQGPVPEEPREPGSQEAEEGLHLPPPPVRTQHRGHRAAVLLLWILLGAALVTAVGYAVASLRPDLVPWASVPAPAPGSSPPVISTELRTPRPLGVALPYSVHISAYQNFAAAHEQLLELKRRHPGILFLITPEEIQGIVYYKVMAGAVTTVEGARAVKQALVADGTLDADEAAGDWTLIEETRFSFVLGQVDSPEGAQASVDSLLARQVPAYALPVPYSDGTRRWHLYAGAFRDSIGASALERQLGEAGLGGRFASRAGAAGTPAP